ncbi:MAG: hypothetical protein IPP57_28665 [Candidatus Obscuribacter sp.]|nr:hypothetical protein [Candidatus Obscuribacter sp.]
MSLNLTYIIGGLFALGVLLYFARPAFKQMINIKAGNAVSGATKLEKMRAEQLALTADVKSSSPPSPPSRARPKPPTAKSPPPRR